MSGVREPQCPDPEVGCVEACDDRVDRLDDRLRFTDDDFRTAGIQVVDTLDDAESAQLAQRLADPAALDYSQGVFMNPGTAGARISLAEIMQATLTDGASHDVDSSVLAFEIASRAASRARPSPLA